LQVFKPVNKGDQLSWKGFPNRSYLQMLSLGTTNNQNGTFTYLPKNGDLRLQKKLIINKVGRVRFLG